MALLYKPIKASDGKHYLTSYDVFRLNGTPTKEVEASLADPEYETKSGIKYKYMDYWMTADFFESLYRKRRGSK